MEKPLKRKRRPVRNRQLITLVMLAAALLGGLSFWYFTTLRDKALPPVPDVVTYKRLAVRQTSEVSRISVSRKSGEGYTFSMKDGRLTLSGLPEFELDESMEQSLLTACAILSVEDTLSQTLEEWEPYKDEFGLDNPKVMVNVTYSDGQTASFSLGDMTPLDGLYYYMLAGDPGLYLASADLIELFDQDVMYFHKVEQPVIHWQRIDSIAMADGAGSLKAAWALDGEITLSGSLTAWRMAYPYMYPCDEAAMEAMLTSLGDLYLGGFVGKATEEAKEQYGLSAPARVITVHQAAGSIASIGADGAYAVSEYQESTLTIAVGAAHGEYVNYCQVGDAIYLISTLSQPLLTSILPEKTLLLQPAAIALEDIASLQVEKGGESRTYVLAKSERLLSNNEFEKDSNGNVVMDTHVVLDGQETDGDAFESALQALQAVTVSGRLPEGFSSGEEPFLRLTFTLADGRKRTLECVSYDALHDGVRVDGVFLHYIPKGALDKGL